MKQPDTDIYEAFMRGDSAGSLAKRFKLDKHQIRKIINRVGIERRVTSPEVLLTLSDEETSIGGSI